MLKTLRSVMAILLAVSLLASCAFATSATIDEEGYLEEILLEDGEQLDQYTGEVDESLQASLDKINSMQNILLVGIDARPGQSTGRSDTMIIVTVDTERNTIKMMSLMRDIYCPIPGHGNNRLNAAYVFGGPELLMQTIEQDFKIEIDNYVTVNFSMLANIIDQIGGITLTVESEYYMDRINAVIKEDNKVLGIDVNDGLLTQPGEQVMTGKQAQAYARYRYGTKDGDFGRTNRQREVIQKIFEKLTDLSLIELATLAAANYENVYTNLTLQDITLLAPAMLSLKDANFEELRIPVDGGYQFKTIDGMSIILCDAQKTWDAIADFLLEE